MKRPFFSLSMRLAFSNTLKCLDKEGLVISNRCAISPAVMLEADRYASILRRTPDDNA